MDQETQDKLISVEVNALYEKLRAFPPKDRLMILTDIATRVSRRLRTGASTQYAIDFSQDEPPTNPAKPDLGESETRAIDVDALNALRKKSTRE